MERNKPLQLSVVLLIAAALTLIAILGCALPIQISPLPAPAPTQPPTPVLGLPSPLPGTPDSLTRGEPQITFTADRASIKPGECATLQWNIQGQGAFAAEINGQPVNPSGQKQVCPQETMVYSLGVDMGTRLVRRQVTIVVGGAEQPTPLPPTPAGKTGNRTPDASGVTLLRDLEFGSYQLGGVTKRLFLDLYIPQGVPKPVPLVIFIHGGGWIEGTKNTCPGKTFAQFGYAVACIDYRLASLTANCTRETTFPAQIQDVKAAVRWLRKNASTYGFAPDKFGAMGASSGSHLAALLGTSHGVAELQGTENLGVSDAVQAVADWYGPIDVRQSPPKTVFEDDPCVGGIAALSAKYGGEQTPFFYWTFAWGAFLGGSLKDPTVLERARQATPLTYVDKADPPFLIIHGEADGMIPPDQSKFLAEALQAAGVQVTFLRLPTAGHGFGGADQEIDPRVDPMFLEPTLRFFDIHLRPGK